jgi:hypothetical protein
MFLIHGFIYHRYVDFQDFIIIPSYIGIAHHCRSSILFIFLRNEFLMANNFCLDVKWCGCFNFVETMKFLNICLDAKQSNMDVMNLNI